MDKALKVRLQAAAGFLAGANWTDSCRAVLEAMDLIEQQAAELEAKKQPDIQEVLDDEGRHIRYECAVPMQAAKLEAMRKDAERYRTLREQFWMTSNLFVVAGGKARVVLGTDCPSLNRLDAMIDAMKGSTHD